jgi:hypothetical protein
MQEDQDFPHLRDETRPEVEWLKAPALPQPKSKNVDGYVVMVGAVGHYVKVRTLEEIDGIIPDGSTP